MRTKLMTAQEVFKNPLALGGDFTGGFNSRVHGQSRLDQYDRGDRAQGFWKADDMILDGQIYYVQVFPHKNCTGHAFQYGGFFVCNTCGSGNLKKPWWSVRVMQDGNAWCCVGEGFSNLQESDNYAFGDTREEAIKNYGELMSNQTKEPA